MKNILQALIFYIFAVSAAYAEAKDVSYVSDDSVNGLRYKAMAEELSLPAKHDLPPASYFSFSYIQSNQSEKLPVTFVFNGGPGSASHWLHFGGLGPKRITGDMESGGPFSVVTSSDNILSNTDLVFIDPIGTGFSKSSASATTHSVGNNLKFWGVVADAKSITSFIQAWLQKHDRIDSPLYIIGESYGALRATLVADELEREHSISVDGLILLSAVQNYRNIRTPDGSIMGYASYLPTYAATAWFHKKAGQNHKELEPFLTAAREFSTKDYATALIKGNRLSDSERSEISNGISAYTGLPYTYIYDRNLRVSPLVFLKQLLPTQRKKGSRLDSRYTGPIENSETNNYGLDPYASVIREPFVQAAQDYLKNTLKVPAHKGDYVANARNHPYWRWNWNVWGEGNVPSGSRFINVIPNLERTLEANPKMKVMVAAGYFDFATPFHSVENAFAELNTHRDRVKFHYYEAGHIIYLDNTARGYLSRDIKAFIKD